MSDVARRMGQNTYFSASTEQTRGLGRLLGGLLREGDVLVLTGDLGAGKTQLTKGIAEGMGATDDVTSPTFTIQMIHEGSELPLYHFDLYRLSDPDELGDAGLYDALGGDGPCVIEWGEQFVDELGDERLDVFLTRLDDEVEPGCEPPRSLRLEPHGTRASELARELSDAAGE